METKPLLRNQIRKETKTIRRVLLLFLGLSIVLTSGLSGENLIKADPEFFTDQIQKEKIEVVQDGNRKRLKLSLKELLHLILNRNLDLQLRKLIDQASQAQLVSAQELNNPVLTTALVQAKTATKYSTNFTGEDKTLFVGTDPYLRTTDTDSTTIFTNWSKKMDSGITISSTLLRSSSQSKLHIIQEEGDELTGGEATDDPLETASLNAKVSIPLFQDWGEVNELPIRRAEIALVQSRLGTISQSLTLLEAVAKTYWNLVRITENIRILQEAVKLSDLLMKETEARVEVGMLQYTDLKEANTQLAANQQELLSMQIQEQVVEDQLRTYLNMESSQVGFIPDDTPEIHENKFDYMTLLEKIYQRNSDLQALKASIKANSFDLDEALNRDKTNLDVEVEYKLKGFGNSLGEAFQGFGKTQFHDYQIGVNWKVPLFDKVTPQVILKRKIEKSQLELRIKNKKLQLGVRLQTILRNLTFALDEKKTATLSLSLAKDLLEKEIEKLKIGKSTSYNVSLVQQRYTKAKFNEMVVRVRNEQNFISLLTLTGEIFSYFKLSEPSSVM